MEIYRLVCMDAEEGNDRMIKYVKGDIFNSPSKIIVNTVNIDVMYKNYDGSVLAISHGIRIFNYYYV